MLQEALESRQRRDFSDDPYSRTLHVRILPVCLLCAGADKPWAASPADHELQQRPHIGKRELAVAGQIAPPNIFLLNVVARTGALIDGIH